MKIKFKIYILIFCFLSFNSCSFVRTKMRPSSWDCKKPEYAPEDFKYFNCWDTKGRKRGLFTVFIYWDEKFSHQEYNYRKDILHGTFAKYWHTGQIAEIGNYKRGRKSGKWYYCWSNGTVHTVRNYKNGKLNGKSKYYASPLTGADPNIVLEGFANFKNGKYHGWDVLYDVDTGNLIYKKKYKNGLLYKEMIYDPETGELIEEIDHGGIDLFE